VLNKGTVCRPAHWKNIFVISTALTVLILNKPTDCRLKQPLNIETKSVAAVKLNAGAV
jgi:hypothetical protein